ncbi:sensor histidine kinase [Mucilaginibacter sp.]
MKLANHYNKANIIISVSMLIISGFIYYSIINHIARKELDDDLSEEVGEFISYVNTNHALPVAQYDENQTTYVKTNLAAFDTRFYDAPYTNPNHTKVEPGRAVSALINLKGQNYIFTIVESREETEYLIQIISFITVILTAILLFVLIITNLYVLNGLWRPFYNILSFLKGFTIADSTKIAIINTNVDEFRELNEAVAKMSARAITEYQGLKTFTENASHEMMTPLSVITSKLDLLIQDERLDSEQLNQITDIYSASNKLARLNQSLLILVKIDNDLLQDNETLDLSVVIFEKAQQFQEIIKNKNITLTTELHELEITASKYLIDLMINNLFSNAIRHNKATGEIKIGISGRTLYFHNSSNQSELDSELIFNRFYKGKTSDGTGLGLAILKNICNNYGFEISYKYSDELHIFQINFN